MKTTTKLKACIILFALALAPKLFAQLEYWRPDKQTGVQIEYHQCVPTSPLHCATIYEAGSDEPRGVLFGNYVP